MKVFLDANILFSLAWKEGSALNRLFQVKKAEYFTSRYAQIEAQRNLDNSDQQLRLINILKCIKIPSIKVNFEKISDIMLKEKDLPILNGAIELGCDHLITGDFRDFGQFYGQKIEGVVVLPPREFLNSYFD